MSFLIKPVKKNVNILRALLHSVVGKTFLHNEKRTILLYYNKGYIFLKVNKQCFFKPKFCVFLSVKNYRCLDFF